MRVYFLTLFPRALESYFNTSMMQRAITSWALDLRIVNLADYSVRNTRRADDRPYGWMPGTIIAPEPCEKAIEEIHALEGGSISWFTPDPRWNILTQDVLSQISVLDGPIGFLCGHYEGIDERVLEYYNIEKISLGKFILTSGELAATVIIDGFIRLIPGILTEDSLREESFSVGLEWKKEYPQYTRPEVWKWLSVPTELTSGNHEKIKTWKKNNRT